MSKNPVFLTDKNHTVILEAVTGVPNAAVPDTCKPFELLTPNTSEGAAEKHLPVVEMCLVTKAGCTMRICLAPDCEPVAHFTLEDGDSVKAAYAYCNLHGFWKTEI